MEKFSPPTQQLLIVHSTSFMKRRAPTTNAHPSYIHTRMSPRFTFVKVIRLWICTFFFLILRRFSLSLTPAFYSLSLSNNFVWRNRSFYIAEHAHPLSLIEMKRTSIDDSRFTRRRQNETFTLVFGWLIDEQASRLVIASNFAAVCFLIKYQNIFMYTFLYFHFTLLHCCVLRASYSPQSASDLHFFSLFFFLLFLHQYDGIGGGQYLLFSFSSLLFFLCIFRVEREAFRWHVSRVVTTEWMCVCVGK